MKQKTCPFLDAFAAWPVAGNTLHDWLVHAVDKKTGSKHYVYMMTNRMIYKPQKVEASSLFTTIMSCESTRTPIILYKTWHKKTNALGMVNKSKWETVPKLRVAFPRQLDDHLNCNKVHIPAPIINFKRCW